MNENGIQKSLEEQLESLKIEQQQAEQIYKRRMEMGALSHDPESVQVLAQTILDRKIKIEELEAQISPKDQEIEKNREGTIQNSEQQEENQKSLVEYHKNPIIRWMQKLLIKMEQVSERMEQKRVARENRVLEPKIYQDKYQEYQQIIDTDFSKSGQAKTEKTPHQLFVEKISGNGAYHTYGKNAQSMETSKTIENLEKSVNQIQKEESYR